MKAAVSRGPRRFAFLLFLAGLVACIVGLRTRNSDLQRSRRLANGDTLTLEGYTFANPHRFVRGNVLQKALLPFAPPPVGPQVFTRVLPGEDTPVVWMHWRHAPKSGSAWYDPPTAYDDSGWEGPLLDGHTRALGGWGGDPSYSFRLPWLPPGTRTWGLRYYDGMQGSRYVVWDFPMPAPPTTGASVSAPRAVPLPAVTKVGDVECTLERFVTGSQMFQRDRRAPVGLPEDARTCALVRLTRRGKPAPDWMPVDLRATTPDHYPFTTDDYASVEPGSAPGEYWVETQGNLHPRVPAWNVALKLARTPHAPFAANQTATFRGIPVPGWGKSVQYTARGKVQGIDVEIGHPQRDVSVPFSLSLNVGTVDPNIRPVVLQAVDDRGRTIKSLIGQDRCVNRLNPPDADWRLAFQTVPGSSKALTVTLALQKTETATFIASPTRPTRPTNNKPWAPRDP